jgi:hypothetical protein
MRSSATHLQSEVCYKTVPTTSIHRHFELRVARSFAGSPKRADGKFVEPYAELGLERGATVEDVKRAYKRLAMQYHPDKGGCAEKFKAVTSAYEVLSSAVHREKRGGEDSPAIFPMVFGSWLFVFLVRQNCD